MIFKRLHTQVEYQGTGVDLAICRKIAKFHSGTISVESEINKGSEFIVKLKG